MKHRKPLKLRLRKYFGIFVTIILPTRWSMRWWIEDAHLPHESQYWVMEYFLNLIKIDPADKEHPMWKMYIDHSTNSKAFETDEFIIRIKENNHKDVRIQIIGLSNGRRYQSPAWLKPLIHRKINDCLDYDASTDINEIDSAVAESVVKFQTRKL